MRSREVFIFLLYAFGSCLCYLNKNMAGPYDVIVRYLESCLTNPGPETIQTDLKHRKINRALLGLDGPMHIGIPFDDNLTATVRLDQFTNGGWKENYFTQDFKKACTNLKKFANNFLKNILKAINSDRKSCPIPIGNYTVKNFILSIEMPDFPIFFYNKYRYYCTLKMKGNTVACFVSEIDIVPKQPKNRG
ncbi:uncharacterized protein LOC106662454 [Cimex lectularius]|uniref:MD-2-related lipid-recognition domain-containing protein n=1 Tax=Cimex lectularius TaxID=79782 RepID=A0A8I6RCF1_CIMLE|nr:uncharacterized protein LOC106662454 [Cimex lectularius]